MSNYLDHADAARRALGPQQLRELSRDRRPGLVVMLTALLWMQLACGMAMAAFGPAWVVVLSFPLIVVVQHAMVLWVHEASHFTLFGSRRFNDLWTNIWFASPIGMNVDTYRNGHMSHHRDLGGEGDLDRWTYDFVMPRGGICKLILLALTGVYGVRIAFRKYGRALVVPDRRTRRMAKLLPLAFSACWNLAFLSLFAFQDRWYLYFLLWLYPVLSSMVLITILHTIAEHQPDGYDGDPLDLEKRPIARTSIPSVLEKWAFFQTNFNYHFEHHAFPTVPFFHLPKVHGILVANGFYDRFPGIRQKSMFDRLAILRRQDAAMADAAAR